MKIPVWVVSISICLLAACNEICYKEPQPKGIRQLSQVPAQLHGYYLVTEEGKPSDTVTILNTGYILNKDGVSYLSDSIVLKYYRGFYFLNSREDFTWHLRIVKRQKNGDLAYLEMPQLPDNEEERKSFIRKLSAEVPVVATELDEKTYYVIDPSPKQLMGLIKKDYFKQQTFTKLN